jgi:two-component system cell cycle response regulator
VIDELRQREASGRRIGVIESVAGRLGGSGGRIVIADDHERQSRRIADELGVEHRPVIETEPESAHIAVRARADLLIVNIAATNFDGLRLAAQIRSDETTRHVPILAVTEAGERTRAMKALEIGVNDLIARPVDPEALYRLPAQQSGQ